MEKETYMRAQEMIAAAGIAGMLRNMAQRLTSLHRFSLRLWLFACCGHLNGADFPNLAAGAEVLSSSAQPGKPQAAVTDGVVDDSSRWLAAGGDARPWVEVRFRDSVEIGAVDVYSGFADGSALAGYDLSFKIGGEWRDAAEA